MARRRYGTERRTKNWEDPINFEGESYSFHSADLNEQRFAFLHQKYTLPELLKRVKMQGDIFTHEILFEILTRYHVAITEEREANDMLFTKIKLLQNEVARLKRQVDGASSRV